MELKNLVTADDENPGNKYYTNILTEAEKDAKRIATIMANIPNVQIYDPTQNIWLSGTPVPGSDYRSFGASGTIIGNTIYYFGGATSNDGFGIQNQVRIGAINPDIPTP